MIYLLSYISISFGFKLLILSKLLTSFVYFYEDSSCCASRRSSHRSEHLCDIDMYDAIYCNDAAQRVLCTWIASVRGFGFYPCLEQIRGACAIPHNSGHRNVLVGSVAALCSCYTVSRPTSGASYEILKIR